jgi:phosphomevalonate kinase
MNLNQPEDCLIVSCPGKVLVAGGYLILFEEYFGISIATSCRFYTKIKKSKNNFTSVHSPQMNWIGEYQYKNDTLIQLNDTFSNQFVENSLFYTLHYLKNKFGGEFKFHQLEIEVSGDEEFYSEEGKRGLGSSASMVSSLCCGLLLFYHGIEDLSSEENLNLANHLSQISHSKAQGKIGSGFDVSTSIFGSQIYQRYSPILIEGIMKNEMKDFTKIMEMKWNDQHENSLRIPVGYDIILGDVKEFKGSNTPSLVKNVLKWKSENQEHSKEIFDKIFKLIQKLRNSWNEKHFEETREIFQEIRKYLKQIGRESNVEIEPDQQTHFIEETLSIQGRYSILFTFSSVLCGVPGAGGFDSLFCVCRKEVTEKVKVKWNQMKIGMIPLKESSGGVKVENLLF